MDNEMLIDIDETIDKKSIEKELNVEKKKISTSQLMLNFIQASFHRTKFRNNWIVISSKPPVPADKSPFEAPYNDPINLAFAISEKLRNDDTKRVYMRFQGFVNIDGRNQPVEFNLVKIDKEKREYIGAVEKVGTFSGSSASYYALPAPSENSEKQAQFDSEKRDLSKFLPSIQ